MENVVNEDVHTGIEPSILFTMVLMYEVEFPDGQVAEYSANVIAENMYTQCHAEGNQYLLLDKIIDWRKDNSTAVASDDMYVYSHNNNQHYRKTTKGWKLCAKWKMAWLPGINFCKLERVLSHRDGWVCSHTRDSWWTCFHMVGTICIGQAQMDWCCCQQTIS